MLNSYTITAQPVTEKTSKLPQGKHLALILDTSYSMREQTKELAKTLTWLQDKILPQNQVDLYLTYSQGIQSEKIAFTKWIKKLNLNNNSHLTNDEATLHENGRTEILTTARNSPLFSLAQVYSHSFTHSLPL